MTRTATSSRSFEIAAPIASLSRFHLDTRNAPRVCPDRTTVLEITGDVPVQVGMHMTVRVRQPPIPSTQAWRVRMADIQPDRRVVDAAERAPFASWKHEHRVAALPDGDTPMTDFVVSALPFGPVGRLTDRHTGRSQLEATFPERHRNIKTLFEGPDRPEQ
jgi:ligand-binding SRPBCC domain-containing protein